MNDVGRVQGRMLAQNTMKQQPQPQPPTTTNNKQQTTSNQPTTNNQQQQEEKEEEEQQQEQEQGNGLRNGPAVFCVVVHQSSKESLGFSQCVCVLSLDATCSCCILPIRDCFQPIYLQGVCRSGCFHV